MADMKLPHGALSYDPCHDRWSRYDIATDCWVECERPVESRRGPLRMERDPRTGLPIAINPANDNSASPTHPGRQSDVDIEREIQAKGLNAPRVTPQRIEEVIASEHYFTAADGVRFHSAAGYFRKDLTPALNLLTFCVLVLKNGFTVTGESACASPENFNAEIGRKIARQNAVQKIWQLEGYLLKQQLHLAASVE